MNSENFNTENLCNDALEMCRKMANLELDYSVDSLTKLDSVIDQVASLKSKGLVNPEIAGNIALPLGTLAGEIMLRDSLLENGFAWHFEGNSEPFISDASKVNAFSPISMIYKRILGEASENNSSMKAFYEVFRFLSQNKI